jgi:capsular polysaccharide export protein
MKYLTLIYNDSFARFFCSIEDEARKLDSRAEFLHLSIFPSGWLYMRKRDRNVSLLPWAVRKYRADSHAAREQEVDRLAAYHYRIAELSNRDVKRFHYADIASRYVRALNEIVANFKPDVVLLSGDTRLPAEALKHVVSHTPVPPKTFYFEQGPVGTTLLDTSGVNANASFRHSLSSITGNTARRPTLPRRERWSRNPLYPGIDRLLRATLDTFGATPAEWRTVRLRRISRRKYTRLTDQDREQALDGRALLVALQVPDDANNIHHNPKDIDDAGLLRRAIGAVNDQKNPWHIIAREHPLYRRRYTKDFYALVTSHENVYLSTDSLEADLQNANSVLTVNSTTGLDAYFEGKQVIVLGNAYYDHLPGIVRADEPADLRTALADAARSEHTEEVVAVRGKIMGELVDRFFIEGHYLDADLKASAEIARRIWTKSLDTESVSTDE